MLRSRLPPTSPSFIRVTLWLQFSFLNLNKRASGLRAPIMPGVWLKRRPHRHYLQIIPIRALLEEGGRDNERSKQTGGRRLWRWPVERGYLVFLRCVRMRVVVIWFWEGCVGAIWCNGIKMGLLGLEWCGRIRSVVMGYKWIVIKKLRTEKGWLHGTQTYKKKQNSSVMFMTINNSQTLKDSFGWFLDYSTRKHWYVEIHIPKSTFLEAYLKICS